MVKYIFMRVVASVFTLWVTVTVVFFMLRLLPGDPARIFASDTATPEEVSQLRERLNLDKPLPYQYALFMAQLAHGDLGTSIRTNTSVLGEIAARLPQTIELAVSSMIIAVLIGVPAGIISAVKRNSWLDSLTSVGTLVGVAIPVYLLGLLLMMIFSVKLQWLPASGNRDGLKSLILPSLTIAAFSMALIARMTRSSVLEVMSKEYTTALRAKGLTERWVILKHVLRNALIPVVTVIGLQFGTLLGGSILTETIFGWPGIGRLLTQSLTSRDYPMVQGVVMVFAACFIAVNLLVDVLYAYIDPRIHY
jgi:peptide/nickel transport system permease protein/oligopeptide transport system permease protein